MGSYCGYLKNRVESSMRAGCRHDHHQQDRDADPFHGRLRRNGRDRHAERQRQRRRQRDEPVAVIVARRGREQQRCGRRCRPP